MENIDFKEFEYDLQRYFFIGAFQSGLCFIFGIILSVTVKSILILEVMTAASLFIGLCYYLRLVKCKKGKVGVYTGEIIELYNLNKVEKTIDVRRSYMVIKTEEDVFIKIYEPNLKKYDLNYVVSVYAPDDGVLWKSEREVECNTNYIIKIIGVNKKD